MDSDFLFNQLSQFGRDLRYNERVSKLVNIFSTLGNIERMIIVNALREKDRCVCELEAILDKSQPSISHHLRELEKLSLIRGWKKGKFTYYSLNRDAIKKNINLINTELYLE